MPSFFLLLQYCSHNISGQCHIMQYVPAASWRLLCRPCMSDIQAHMRFGSFPLEKIEKYEKIHKKEKKRENVENSREKKIKRGRERENFLKKEGKMKRN